MPKTRQQIREAVRHKVGGWSYAVTTLNGSLTASATSVVVTSAASMAPRMLLEVDSETMLIVSISSNTLTVVRGFHDTTAATHSDAATASAYQSYGWTNNQCNLAIDEAVTFTSQDPFPLWSHKFYSGSGANAWPLNTYELDIGNGITNWPDDSVVLNLEFQTDESPARWEPVSNFIQRQSILRIAKAFGAARIFRVEIARYQPLLSNDASSLDRRGFEPAVILFASYWLLKDLQGSRVKFIEYSATLSDRASTADELLRTAFDFKNQAELAKRAAYIPMPKSLRRWRGGQRI